MKCRLIVLLSFTLLDCSGCFSKTVIPMLHNDPMPSCYRNGILTRSFVGPVGLAMKELSDEAQAKYHGTNYLRQESLTIPYGDTPGTLVATAFSCPPEAPSPPPSVLLMPPPPVVTKVVVPPPPPPVTIVTPPASARSEDPMTERQKRRKFKKNSSTDDDPEQDYIYKRKHQETF